MKYRSFLILLIITIFSKNFMCEKSEEDKEDIYLDSNYRNPRSNIEIYRYVDDQFSDLKDTITNFFQPFKQRVELIFQNMPKISDLIQYDMNAQQRTLPKNKSKKPLSRKIIKHENSKNKDFIATKTLNNIGSKRWLDYLPGLNKLCKRQLFPFCRPPGGPFPCFGPSCNFPGSNGPCLPGSPNCILTPIMNGNMQQANGILLIPKICPSDIPLCNTNSNVNPSPLPADSGTSSDSNVVPAVPPVPSVPTKQPDSSSVMTLPAAVELHIDSNNIKPDVECCSPNCQNEDKCLILNGRRYRLVPDDLNPCIGPECSDFVDQSSLYDRRIPVPEDCISTIKDMDFSAGTLRQAPQCQRAAIRVVVNLGRTLSSLLKAINQVYNVGGCSLNGRDTKLLARSAHQLLLNGCCSPNGGNLIKIGGGCKK